MIRTAVDLPNRLFSLMVAVGLLASCGQQPSAHKAQNSSGVPKSDIEEMRADVAAVNKSPSVSDPSKFAGPPIHLDPYPKSSGAHHGHHAGMKMK